VVTQYLLDVQPGLWKVLAADDGTNTNRYLHGPTGIHAHENNVGDWQWMVQDALGSVRAEVDDVNAAQAMQNYTPYGVPFGAQGSFDAPFQFAGEPIDQNDLVQLRARYYDAEIGQFFNQDPSNQELNLYGYALQNPIVNIDPSGQDCRQATPPGPGCQLMWTGNGFEFVCPEPTQDPVDPFVDPFTDDSSTLAPQPQTDAQRKLEELCKKNDLEACYILQLSYLCRAGDDASCDKILEKCNQYKAQSVKGDKVEAICASRSRCSQTKMDEIKKRQDQACSKPHQCRSIHPGSPDWQNREVAACQTIARNIRRGEECLKARNEMVDECFQGKADDGHQGAINQTEAAIDRCWERFIFTKKFGGFACDLTFLV